MLGNVHSHFVDPKYLGFVVVTQSCDLVRRAKVKAPYIAIAAVRELDAVIEKLLAAVLAPVDGIFPKDKKQKAREFLDRLVDQNEQSGGLFYLHQDADVGIAYPAVVFLRITVALRAEHYDCLVDARRGRLRADFQAKLGWLVGNLYARPAARDWDDTPEGKREKKELCSELLRQVGWMDSSALKAARDAGEELTGKDAGELTRLEKRYKPKPPKERLVELLHEHIQGAGIDEKQGKSLVNNLRVDPILETLLKN